MDTVSSLATHFLAADEPAPLGWGIMAYVGVVFVVIFAFAIGMRPGLKDRVFKRPIAQLSEQAYLFVENMCLSVIGEKGRKYVPLMLTIWLIVFTSNMVGLLLPHTPSADWSFNFGMAVLVVAYVQFEGMRSIYDHDVAHGKSKGVALLLAFPKYLKHFAGPKLSGALVVVTALLFAIEIVSELLRMLTLSLRLYGNIHGGHLVRDSLDHMIKGPVVAGHNVLIPLGLLVLPLELFAAVIQALVFTILGCVYISLVVNHEGDEEHEEKHADAHAPA